MKIRAIIDGKGVMGWYVCLDGYHHIVPFDASVLYSMCIDIALCAEDTGRDDKHGERIFGSRGKMQGGDRVFVRSGRNPLEMRWIDYAWRLSGDNGSIGITAYSSAELEIIPRKESE